ncbi:MAG TPA: signal peptidase II [Acidobacteria bacterium]|jgi:signal peptidase II|nr:signal peptidase II [Acidobacteriota bacterium]
MMFGFAASILFVDQSTKALVRHHLALHESISIIPDFLDFRYVQNTGAAFGILNNADIPFKPALMTAVALFALIALVLYTSRLSSEKPLAKIGLTAIIGGACGNLADRISTGYVVDFIDVYWGTWHFWAFNVADASITVGAGCLILDMALLNKHVSETT